MSLGVPITPSRRLESLDVLRGVTIAAMLLVNNPGSWGHIYPPLEHAAWNGWTFTDLVFPFFLFMVGMAMMYSFPKRLEAGDSRKTLFLHVVRRAFALMVLGWWGSTWTRIFWPGDGSVFHQADAGFGALSAAVLLRVGFAALVLAGVVLLAGTRRTRDWTIVLGIGALFFLGGSAVLGFDDALPRAIARMRIPGVLVRIGACYLLASAIYFATPDWRSIAKWLAGLLTLYALWMTLVPIPGFGIPDLSLGFPTADTDPSLFFSNWESYVDFHVFGAHTWSARQLYDASGNLVWSFDPEGLLSTIPAVCTVLFGVLAGMWMRRTDLDDAARLNGLFVGASWLLVLGLVVSIWMPINKNLWTSSYSIFMAGMALITLAVLYHAVDMKGWRGWALPFRSYGRNAIFAFVASGMMASAVGRITVRSFDGTGDSSVQAWSYDAMVALFGDPTFASFVWAMLFVTFWAAVAWWMDQRKIYFKV